MGENVGETPLPQPGWYSDPVAPHQARWWDGRAWTEHVSVPAAAAAAPAQATVVSPRRRPVWPWVVGILVAVTPILLVFGSVVSSSGGDSTSSAPRSSATAEPVKPAAPQLSRGEQIDQFMAEQGYTPAVQGDIYFRALDPSEFTCGTFDCIYYALVTVDGCSSGIYVAASIETEGGVSVGQANDITAGLQPEGQAVVELNDYTGNGSVFRLTDVHCMG